MCHILRENKKLNIDNTRANDITILNKLDEECKEVIKATKDYHKDKTLSNLKEIVRETFDLIQVCILSLIVLLSSSLSLFKLAPEVTVEPFLIIKQDASDGVVRYEPIALDMASKKQLMELFVKQYVILRNTIIRDEKEMMLRWYPGGMVNYLSSDYVFSVFNAYREEMWEKIFKSKIVREVEIISATKQGGENSPIWKVDFRTYDIVDYYTNDKTKGKTLKIGYWTASVTAFFIPQRQFVGLRLINPLGFTVARYSQTEVNF